MVTIFKVNLLRKHCCEYKKKKNTINGFFEACKCIQKQVLNSFKMGLFKIYSNVRKFLLTDTVTKSCPIFLAAGVFLVISFIVFLIPTCSHQNNLYYFSAGILFIVSGEFWKIWKGLSIIMTPKLRNHPVGLVMLIGLIAYISILKAEIGSKLRPRSTLQPALIKVSYGQSFFLFVFGFIVTEFVGVLNIFLFINLQEVSYYSVSNWASLKQFITLGYIAIIILTSFYIMTFVVKSNCWTTFRWHYFKVASVTVVAFVLVVHPVVQSP